MILSAMVTLCRGGGIVTGRDVLYGTNRNEDWAKSVLAGKIIVMDETKARELGKPMPGHLNWIFGLAGNLPAAFDHSSVVFFKNIQKLGKAAAKLDDSNEAVVLGCQDLYEKLTPWIKKLYLTSVCADVVCEEKLSDFAIVRQYDCEDITVQLFGKKFICRFAGWSPNTPAVPFNVNWYSGEYRLTNP